MSFGQLVGIYILREACMSEIEMRVHPEESEWPIMILVFEADPCYEMVEF